MSVALGIASADIIRPKRDPHRERYDESEMALARLPGAWGCVLHHATRLAETHRCNARQRSPADPSRCWSPDSLRYREAGLSDGQITCRDRRLARRLKLRFVYQVCAVSDLPPHVQFMLGGAVDQFSNDCVRAGQTLGKFCAGFVICRCSGTWLRKRNSEKSLSTRLTASSRVYHSTSGSACFPTLACVFKTFPI